MEPPNFASTLALNNVLRRFERLQPELGWVPDFGTPDEVQKFPTIAVKWAKILASAILPWEKLRRYVFELLSFP